MTGDAMEIIKARPEDIEACLRIGRALPEYFNEKGIELMGEDLQACPSYIAIEDNSMLGFATVKRIDVTSAELAWLAVRPDKQGGGVGTELLEFIARDLKDKGCEELIVKTLSSQVNYQPYEVTRRFYEKNGFELKEELISPIWGPENPQAIYVRKLK